MAAKTNGFLTHLILKAGNDGYGNNHHRKAKGYGNSSYPNERARQITALSAHQAFGYEVLNAQGWGIR